MTLMQSDRKGVGEQTLNDGSTIIIRRYHEDDLSAIYELERLSFSPSERYTEQHLEMLGQFQSYCFLVAVQNDKIRGYTIGVLKLTREGPMGHIISVAVHPSYRRRGIGITLVNGLMEQLKDVGAIYFRLEVKRANQAARSMYRGLGFNYEYILRNYYGDGKDAIVMKMRL